MNIKKLAQGLVYSGEVEGMKQTYYVFSAADSEFYLVMSFSGPAGGNFNIVESEAVEYVLKRCSGEKGVTSTAVVEKAKKTRHAHDSFAALNILYVLAATRRAVVDGRRRGHKQLFFNVKA